MEISELKLPIDLIEPIDVVKKQVIYQSGQKSHDIYYLESGLVGLYQTSEVGNERLLRLYGTGSYFGYRTLFANGYYPSSAKAMLGSRLKRIKLRSIEELSTISPKLLNHLAQEVCTELGEAEHKIMQFNTFNSRIRVLDALDVLFNLYPDYPWTYREVGEFSGTDITTVLRTCKQLKSMNILDKSTRKISLLDMDALIKYRAKQL
ncbi:Crp/Fnr family transcriptional regulator [Vibrio aquaticus]|uniref:Crp/Fnr family transcriptional regulator n=1 Tax=Vibrio aquaticus TaxID=2496559 RepID=A0A432D282_9VIBR|nr:Crp/Fnr family transcriptional regulator [Vibrio aquaticus]RTZ18031.1 Crp/Fnr family transcriptional regulator [Vibrio aquaticus]